MTFRHSGDFGDVIVSLAIVHAVGEPENAYYLVNRPGITSPMGPRSKPLIALIKAQPYINDCRMSEAKVDCDFVMFRRFHGATRSLMSSHLREFNKDTGRILDLDGSKPWLFVEPSKKAKGKIAIARSPRYNNLHMPWKEIVEHYGERLFFLGHPDEHTNFVRAYGWVEHFKTQDMLEVAQLIAGSELAIMNQSSPLNIAIGLGHPFIEEVCIGQPDCIYPRSNAQYVSDGSCTLPDIGGSGVLSIPTPEMDYSGLNKRMVPPGYWQYPDLPACPNFEIQKNLVAKLKNCDDYTADIELIRYNVQRVPAFFSDRGENPLGKFKEAYQLAYGTQPKP